MLIKVQEAYRTLSGLGQKRKSGHTIIKAKCTEQSENTKSCKGNRASNKGRPIRIILLNGDYNKPGGSVQMCLESTDASPDYYTQPKFKSP